MRNLIMLMLVIAISACQKTGNNTASLSNKKVPKIFNKVPSSQSGIDFVNTIENTEKMNIFSYRNFYNGGGVAIGDIDNDGLSDVFMTSNAGENKLYRNTGNFKFEDITEKAGIGGKRSWSTGVVMVDINNDGLLDIYVCAAGFQFGNEGYINRNELENELYINNGDLTFTEKAAEYNLNENGYTTHAAFFDYDLDGDLDVYILNNSFIQPSQILYQNKRNLYDKDWDLRDMLKGGGDKLMRNDGGKFTDVSKEAGVFGSLVGFGLGITVGDINGDNYPDMYVSNDFFERDYLYINQKDGTFKEDIESWMQHLSLSSMGADMADINNDGYPEVFTTEMLPDDEYKLKTNTSFDGYTNYAIKVKEGFSHQYMHNTLQLNNQDETFSEIAFFSGVAASDWSWGALMMDADNDGYRDIYVCNGIYQDVIDQDFINFFANKEKQRMVSQGTKAQMKDIISKMPSNPIPNKFYRNNKNLKFDDQAKNWGLGEPSFSNGAAYGDLDNDGDLDLIVNNVNQESFVFENKTNEVFEHHYLTINLKGDDKNTFAIGSKAIIHKGDELLNFQMIPSRGFQSSVDYKMVFGLGDATKVDKVEIIWFDQSYTVLENPQIDQILTIDYKTATRTTIPKTEKKAAQPIVKSVNTAFEAHKEDDYVDFFYEGLTMRMVSREGPCLSVGDVNGDGKEDVFIGGAVGQAGKIYSQTNNGFQPIKNELLDKDALFEDVTSSLFDADNDGDLDLFVGSGGNHVQVNNRGLLNRLYVNDGKGQFKLHVSALPPTGFNTGVVLPLDYDKDGDLDLFVGNRSMPNNYGVPPRSYILENDGTGLFKNVSDGIAKKFRTIGMITDAIWMDITGDKVEELIIVGEWMSPKIFTYKKETKQFESLKSNLSDYSGWWYSIASDDVDGDGDQDLIMGNRGENFYFSGTKEAPAKLWIWDFDGNQTYEKIITRSVNGKDMPVVLKNELTAQIVSLKKENLLHHEYAKKSIHDLFPKDMMKKALLREGNYFKSAVAINEGNGQFTMQELPNEVQFSCVCDIYCTDLNADGRNDLILGGNDNGFLPQFSKLDASFGHILLNAGNGKYERITNKAAGLYLKGNVKNIRGIKIKDRNHVLAVLNNELPQLFEIQK